jgi:serine/threonine-protein kinase
VFEVGEILAGKYRVDRVIGRGGMGVVVGATHIHLQQPVALKVLLPEVVDQPGVVERFVREARASAQLRSEHVCRVTDVGEVERAGPGIVRFAVPFIVMELLEGDDLSSLLHAHGAMPVSRVADHVLQACVGVAEAHALGIVHRDLKPANLFLTRRPDGTPLIKVLDFGIAKAHREQQAGLTQTSAMLGSPGYMSPEQLRTPRDVDARSDVWALGVILYELVAGRRPFVGETITEIAFKIAMDPAPLLVGSLPRGFAALVDRCLAKDPAQRYPDLANLAHALAGYAGPGGRELAGAVARMLPRGTQRREPASAVSGFAPMPTTTPTTIGGAASSMVTAPARRRSRRWAVAGGIATTLAVGAVVAAVALRTSGSGAGAGPPPVRAATTAERPAAPAPEPPAPSSPPAMPAVRAAEPAAPPPAEPPPPVHVAPGDVATTAAAPGPTPPTPEVRPPAPARPATSETSGPQIRSPARPPKTTRPPRREGARRPEPRPPEDLGASRF